MFGGRTRCKAWTHKLNTKKTNTVCGERQFIRKIRRGAGLLLSVVAVLLTGSEPAHSPAA